LKVCDALAFAHDRNIIHCDLKPENIMVGEFGEAYLMDWGIASMLQGDGPPLPAPSDLTGVRGTPDFMSPEQATADPRGPTKRTDVFGLGAVLYFILTGRAPFGASTTAQALARAKKCNYDDPETVAAAKPPAALVRIVRKAMAADPTERFASVLELRQQVDQVVRGDWDLPTKTYPPGTTIVREGEWADAAYIIVNGSCLVWKTVDGERRLLRTLGPGAVFGETSILSGDVRTATVETVGEVGVRVVTRELFQDQLGVDSWLHKFVLALADRFRELEQRAAPADSGVAEPRPR
ncbi:MAG: cyclic nucleotide-binding domain-containing protein, partial [Polyangia bacterium]